MKRITTTNLQSIKRYFQPKSSPFHILVCRVSREGGKEMRLLSNQIWLSECCAPHTYLYRSPSHNDKIKKIKKSCTIYKKKVERARELELVKWEIRAEKDWWWASSEVCIGVFEGEDEVEVGSSLILNERLAHCLLPEPGLRLRGTSSTTIFSPAVILTPARLLGLI